MEKTRNAKGLVTLSFLLSCFLVKLVMFSFVFIRVIGMSSTGAFSVKDDVIGLSSIRLSS